LARDDEGGFEAGLFGDELVELLYLGVVAIENLEERCLPPSQLIGVSRGWILQYLCAGRAFDAPEPKILTSSLDVLQVL
jgi:hypothetical protein